MIRTMSFSENQVPDCNTKSTIGVDEYRFFFSDGETTPRKCSVEFEVGIKNILGSISLIK